MTKDVLSKKDIAITAGGAFIAAPYLYLLRDQMTPNGQQILDATAISDATQEFISQGKSMEAMQEVSGKYSPYLAPGSAINECAENSTYTLTDATDTSTTTSTKFDPNIFEGCLVDAHKDFLSAANTTTSDELFVTGFNLALIGCLTIIWANSAKKVLQHISPNSSNPKVQ